MRWVIARSRAAASWIIAALKWVWASASATLPLLLFRLGAAAAFLLAYKVVENKTDDTKRVAVAAGLGVLGLLLATIRPGDLRSRLTKLSFAGVGVEFEAKAASVGATPEDPLERPVHPDDALDLRLLLEAKLAYVCKQILAPVPELETETSPVPAYATFGSLEHDGYISRDQARTASRLLVLGAAAPNEKRTVDQTFFEEARSFVGSFRVIVFSAHVRKLLEGAGWTVMRVYPLSDSRRDLLIKRGTDEHVVVPALATASDSELLKKIVGRLESSRFPLNSGGKRIVVIPDVSKADRSPDADPGAMDLTAFREGYS